MKKKVFSLMMTLVLAFMGVARADEVTVQSDGTTSSSQVPYMSYFDDFTRTQIVVPSSELAAMNGGTISSVKFYVNASTSASNLPYTTVSQVDVYVKEVGYTSISAFEPKSSATMVYQGTLNVVAGRADSGSMTITFSTPYTYNGGNLLIGIENTTDSGYKFIYWSGATVNGASISGYNASSLANVNPSQRNFMPKMTFTYTAGGGGTGGGGTVADLLHVKDMNGVVDTLDLGVRPAGAWMAPYSFKMYNEGTQAATVSVLDFTPNDGFFSMAEGTELPFTLAARAADSTELFISTGGDIAETGEIAREFVAIYENSRLARIWPIKAEVYTPECPDVWELACEEPNTLGYPFVEVPNRTHGIDLHNDYTLPFPEIPEGYDAVYKLTFTEDQMVSASVTAGADGKVALYTEDFYGEGGPMAHNNYTGDITAASGGGMGGSLTVHDGTVTNQYIPLYGYNGNWYTKVEMIYPATELTAMRGQDINSMKFYLSQYGTRPGMWSGTWKIFLKEVANTTISSFTGETGASVVYQGTLSGMEPEMTINFSTPYRYNGGNLLVGFYQPTTGSWGAAQFYGETVNGASLHGESLTGGMNQITSGTQRNFLPKTTFNYGSSRGSRDVVEIGDVNPFSPASGSVSAERADVQLTFRDEAAPGEIAYGPVIKNLPVVPGTYYLVASSTEQSMEVTINAEAMPCPESDPEAFAFGPFPADNDNEVEPSGVTLRWNVPTYATGWRLVFGSTYHPEPDHDYTILYPEDGSWSNDMSITSYDLPDLFNNTNYFWHVEFNNDGCPDGVSSPIWGFTTHLNIPHGLTATPEAIIEGETTTLNWTSVVDRTYRFYNIYKDGVLIHSTTANDPGTTWTVPATELAYNPTGYIFNVTAVYDEGESAFSNDVTVKVTGYSATNGIYGYVYEQDGTTGIPGATVTVTGTTEFGIDTTFSAMTDETGYYEMQVLVGNYTYAIATCPGYQDNDEPYGVVPPIDVTYQSSNGEMNFNLDENFCAPVMVCAEKVYVPGVVGDTLVKVWWEMGEGCDNGGGGTGQAGLMETFDEGINGWTTIDADGDGWCWKTATEFGYPNCGHNNSAGFMASESYGSGGYYLTPDNYLVSPKVRVNAGDVLSFWQGTYSELWNMEYYGVFVSTASNDNPADFQSVAEWQIRGGESGARGARDDNGRALPNDTWTLKTVDLSQFAGQDVYIAFRHFNCTSEWALLIDDVMLGSRGLANRALNHYRIYRTDCYNYGPFTAENTELLATAWVPDTAYFDVSWPDAAPGVYKWGVGVVYEGNRESAIRWSESRSNRETLTYDFTDGLQGWTSIDADGDGEEWYYNSYDTQLGHDGAPGMATSASYVGYAVYPDNYLVSPQLALGGTISFWANAQDASYPAEKFGVAVSTTGNTNAADFTTLQSWTLTAKGTSGVKSEGRDGPNRPQGAWYQFSVDLSDYAGQTGYVAIRHFDCYDQFRLNIDDVTLGASGTPTPGPTPGENTCDNALALPRESCTMWSDMCSPCIDKDMYIGVTVNVLLNSADSPAGTTVSFTNLNPMEQDMHPQDMLTLGETGFHAYESFRRGSYAIEVYHEGYYTIFDTVNIGFDPNDTRELRYVMTEILYPIRDLYVSRTGWAMWERESGWEGGSGVTPPTPPTDGETSFTEGFETGLNGWNTIKVNAAGGEWLHSSANPGGHDYNGLAHDGSAGFAMCYSFIDYVGSYDTDAILYTPQKYQIVNGSTLKFYADNANDDYPESFSVVVATAENPTAADFVQVWGGNAKANNGQKANVRHDDSRYNNWRLHTVDLSAYAGQSVWIGFRDTNYDAYEIWIDDVELTAGRNAEQTRQFNYYKVMCTSIDGEPIFNHNTVHPFCQVATDELVEGNHYICKVAAMFTTGLSEWREVEFQYEPCDHWGPVDFVNADVNSQGNHLVWEFNHGHNQWIDPLNPENPQGEGSTFTEGFENGIPADWTLIDGGNPAGYGWQLASVKMLGEQAEYAHGGVDFVLSQSYQNSMGPITPDNYLITPQVTLGSNSVFSFWACAQDDGDSAEHFGVFVSTTGTAASDFSMVQEWTIGRGNGVSGKAIRGDRQTAWQQYSVNLGAYAGQQAYIAIRHFNCNNMFYLDVDDIELSNGRSSANDANVSMIESYKSEPVYSQYAEDGIKLNFFGIRSTYFRAYLLYTLTNDSRFVLTPDTDYGQFLVTPAGSEANFMAEFESFYANAEADFALLSKDDVATNIPTWKSSVTPSHSLSIMMDIIANSTRVDNDQCINSLPFCTTEAITFPAASGMPEASENADYGCMSTSPNPAWYHMRIQTGGPFVIHMEADNAYGDIDFVIWGPFTDPTEPCFDQLTADKIIDCSYSTAAVEDCFLGYHIEDHDHGGSFLADGTINYHVPEAGEYYILLITNYDDQPCNISFTKTEGEGETDCEIVSPTNIIGFLITQDGEYLDFVGPDEREYTHVGEFGEHEYCVRPIYPGPAILPDTNYFWAMGCPVCVTTSDEPVEICEPVSNFSGYYMNYEGQEGLVLDWEAPAGATAIAIYVEEELLGEIPADMHPIFLGFEGEVPEYTFNLGAVAIHADCESEMVTTSVYYDDVVENKANVAIFPNPTNGNVKIMANGMRHVTVVSTLGQVLYDADVNADEMDLNMAQFNAGVYMVRIVTESGISTQRVTVVR